MKPAFHPARPTARVLRGLGLTPWLAAAAWLGAGTMAQAQPTATDLGSYTLCRTASAGQGCQQMSLQTAARFGPGGARNGTTGVLTLRNLQGTTALAPNGTAYATGTGASVLTGVTLYTQGCLPGQPCASPDFFDGLPFNSTQSGATVATALGAVGGSVPTWNWVAAKPLAADNPNILRFDANTRFVGNFSNVQILGIGGCTEGGGQLQGQFRDVVQEARTCDSQSLAGALQFAFDTSFVFDPTYFLSFRIDWAQQATAGIGAYAPYFCAASASRRGDALLQASGGCSVFDGVSAVPEPSASALWALGLAAWVCAARRGGRPVRS